MQWFGGKESDDVEEGSSSGGIGGRHFAFGGGILGLIGLVIYLFTGINPSQLLSSGVQDTSQQVNSQVISGNENTQTKFARVVFQGTEEVWDSLFNAAGKKFTHPVLHFYTGQVDAQGCGIASSATGPFYCPADQKIYLDLSFFQQLREQFQSPGEAAEAYVIAHEFGHHIQNLLGVSTKMEQARGRLSQTDYNKLSVKLELQADFYAGVWAHYEAKYNQNGIKIDRADVDSALVAANAIGDDRLQQQNGAVLWNPIVLPTALRRSACIGLRKGMIPVILIREILLPKAICVTSNTAAVITSRRPFINAFRRDATIMRIVCFVRKL